MLPVLKTILSRLETIEKKLADENKVEIKAKVSPPSRQEDTALIQSQIEKARHEAKEILIEAKDEAFRLKREAEEEARKVRVQAMDLERKVVTREEALAGKSQQLEDFEKRLREKEERISQELAKIDKLRLELIEKLEKAAKLTREEAKNLILKAVEERSREDVAKIIRDSEAEARHKAQDKAREILVEAMRFAATDYVPEYTVSTIKIDDDFKGRIIGKEGRNIRAFEMATGVDVDLDEEGVIRISSFDSVRREIARVTLEKLIKDGRIQPVRIEELVKQTEKEIRKIMDAEGEKLCHSVNVYNMPAELVSLLGRFKYRFSYGQNMIAHTLEETRIGIALAHELKADVNVVRLGCLLHDVGKVVADKEGSHVHLGVELLKKYNMPNAVIDCVASHHEDIPFPSVEAMIVYIADAISGSRPGARYEDIGEYIKRLTTLEDIAKSFDGVEKAYALQAGRELRVIIVPDKLDDAATVLTTKKIAEEVEKKFPTFPGQIKVTSIREYRNTQTVH